jgi:hypothetical protein
MGDVLADPREHQRIEALFKYCAIRGAGETCAGVFRQCCNFLWAELDLHVAEETDQVVFGRCQKGALHVDHDKARLGARRSG